jgi:hypothetical protein
VHAWLTFTEQFAVCVWLPDITATVLVFVPASEKDLEHVEDDPVHSPDHK